MTGDTFPNTVWLEEFFNNLVAFMDDLRREGYHIGVSQYSVVQDLLLACVTQAELPDEQTFIRQFKEYIRPVLCTSAQEQAEFYQRYDDWFPIAQKALEGVEEQVDLQAAQVETNLRRLPWLRWAALVMATVVLALLGQQYFVPGVSTPTAVPTIVTPIPTTPMVVPPLTDNTTIAFHTTSPLTVTPEITEGPTLQPTISPTPTAVPPSPPSNEAILWFGVPLTFLVLLLVIIIIINRRNRMVLARLATVENPQTVQISIDMDRKTILDPLQFLLVARQMRQRVPKSSNELEVNCTIEASIEQGGWFTPVYKDRQVLPEYLILIDRTSRRDHQAQFIDEMIAELKQNDVHMRVLLFDGDPRICMPLEDNAMPKTLDELAHRYSEDRLIIFTDGSKFFSPITGEKYAWLKLFEAWSERAMMTPVFVDQWGYQEHILQNDFVVLPATPDGLLLLTDYLYNRNTAMFIPGYIGGAFPEELDTDPLSWTSRNLPDPEELTSMMHQLRRYLDDASFFWLGACAVYPNLVWNLTLYLGKNLQDAHGNSLLTPQRLIALSRLPWFRQGYMPDWLRTRLIAQLTPQQEQQTRLVLANILETGAQEGEVKDFSLEIAKKQRKTLVAKAQHILRQLRDVQPEDSPINEHIFVQFMLGRKLQPLWVRVPNALRELLQGKKQSWVPMAIGTVVLVLALVLVENFVPTIGQPPTSTPTGSTVATTATATDQTSTPTGSTVATTATATDQTSTPTTALSNAVDTQTAAVKQATIAAAATANAVDTQTAAVRQNTTAAAATATDAFVATAFANAAATQTAAVKQTAAVAATAAATDAFVATATANATEEVMVTVPNVVGTDSGSAEAAIYGSGLVANTTFGGTGCTPYMVNWQDPAAGTQVSTGSSVTIQVCPGIVVPNVIGMDKNAASGTLSNAGLGVSLVSTCDGDKPDGQVWSTAPGPGSSVSPGTVVTVNYYTGCGDDIINAIP